MPSTLDHPDKREPTPPTPAQHPPQSHRNSIVLPSISESIPEFGSPHHNTQTTAPDPATASQSAPSTGQGQIVFTRKLWHRSMPNEPIDVLVSRHPDKLITDVPNQSDASASHRATSSISRPLRSPHSPSTDSRTPLTPEESPPYRSTRKRRASTLEADERALESAEPSPSHARANSGDSAVQVCICQPDPKIPRPRNAFILYRQHHQANVIAEHPGLANPEISKIIGEQWRNQPAEVKNEWKRLAEEEKIRHQQQYPSYRYQPKRNTRRNSLTEGPGSATGERAKCPKCGGRTNLAPTSYGNYTPLDTSQARVASPSFAPQASTVTPVSRTLPVLRELTLQSPASSQMGRPFAAAEMSPRRVDERETAVIMSPDSKKRRFNSDQPIALYRAVPPRVQVGSPMAPYLVTQAPHPYPAAQGSAQTRRESLPSLRMMSPPGPMAPPPRPGMGYQQHRLSQGGPDRSLTLPPLKTGNAVQKHEPKTSRDVIMSLPLSEKLEVLRRIAPPAPLGKRNRGPLIAIEGDDIAAVQFLAKWLVDMLDKEPENSAQLVESPDVAAIGDSQSAMAEYHVLAAEWLNKSKSLLSVLNGGSPTTPSTGSAMDTGKSQPATGSAMDTTSPTRSTGSAMDTSTSNKSMGSAMDTSTSQPKSAASAMEVSSPVQEDVAMSSPSSLKDSRMSTDLTAQRNRMSLDVTAMRNARNERMSIDAGVKQARDDYKSIDLTTDEQNNVKPPEQSEDTARMEVLVAKPVLIIPSFSLHATNIFACRIPISDVYSPKEHWQWSATLWRGVIGPDLTIYVRDVAAEDAGKAVEQSEAERLFVVRRAKTESKSAEQIEAATLRRVVFEVSEWVRAFGSDKR